jgi:hypothetical protein
MRLGFLGSGSVVASDKVQRVRRDGPDRQRKAPRERKSLTRGLSVPRYGGRWGERRLTYKRRAPIAKGRSRASVSAPLLPLLKCPHTRKEKISNSDDEIAAGLGQEAPRRIPDDDRTNKGLSGWLRPATGPVEMFRAMQFATSH